MSLHSRNSRLSVVRYGSHSAPLMSRVSISERFLGRTFTSVGKPAPPQAHKHPVALLDTDFAGRTHMLPHAGALPQQGFEIHSSLPPMSLEVDWIFLYYSNSISPAMLICTNKNYNIVHFV